MLCRGLFTPGHNKEPSRIHDNVHGCALRQEQGGYPLEETFAEVCPVLWSAGDVGQRRWMRLRLLLLLSLLLLLFPTEAQRTLFECLCGSPRILLLPLHSSSDPPGFVFQHR